MPQAGKFVDAIQQQAKPQAEPTPKIPEYAKPGPYATKLEPHEEAEYQQWVKKNKIPWKESPHADYDMRGYWKAMKSGDPIAKRNEKNQHFPDRWKTPYHTLFSGESMYAVPDKAPRWVGKKLIDKSGKVIYEEK